MTIRELVRSNRDEILRIAREHGATRVRVFGSIARGEDDESSDLDLLVDLEPARSLLDLGGMWADLHDLLGIKIDIVTPNGLRPRIKDRVLREALPL